MAEWWPVKSEMLLMIRYINVSFSFQNEKITVNKLICHPYSKMHADFSKSKYGKSVLLGTESVW